MNKSNQNIYTYLLDSYNEFSWMLYKWFFKKNRCIIYLFIFKYIMYKPDIITAHNSGNISLTN